MALTNSGNNTVVAAALAVRQHHYIAAAEGPDAAHTHNSRCPPYPHRRRIEIEIVYNMSRQNGPSAVSRATLLRHTGLISK
jgi:hypothetical protein